MLNIGVDARNLIVRPTGIGRYIIESCKSLIDLGHTLHLYLPSTPVSYEILPDGAHLHVSHWPGSVARIIWGGTEVGRLARRDNVDVFWGPAHRLPLRGFAPMPTVLTIHDLVWLVASDTMRARNYYAEKALMLPALRNATRIVSVSEATRKDIVTYFPEVAYKVNHIYPGWVSNLVGVGAIPVKNTLSMPRYGLFVGTLEPRKNLLNLLEAYALLPEKLRRQNGLVIAGGQGWRMPNLRREIARLGLTDCVQLRGYVTDEELGELYRHARFLAMPSRFEGFGLPIIEANSFGVPVITSNRSSMPEVVGEAGLLVDPDNVDSIKQALLNIMIDDALHSYLCDKARKNISRFDWQKCAEGLTEVFERAISQYKGGH
ncbi:glycosyltransferase family 4 protein [Brucella anthropi]|uniref:glycosyltransferase family 4 protein n=1 Tax=Brucella anthropi TaxID=529 RepID=UPI0005BACE8B|nr:glycosyltransferase family 1 protein [Brucella anthropi]KIU69732.1 hypothetical protein TR92_04430 [Brucella anthropi]